MRTARWRTSGANLLVVLIITGPSSQELGPPTIPGRFKVAEAALLDRAYSLLSYAPLAYKDLISNLPSRSTFDTLVSAGAYESAALRLMSRRMGFFSAVGQVGQIGLPLRASTAKTKI